MPRGKGYSKPLIKKGGKKMKKLKKHMDAKPKPSGRKRTKK